MPLLDKEHNTCVTTTIAVAEAELMHTTLKKNMDLFVWTTSNMSGISPDIMTHKLSVFKEARSVTQKERNHGWEKRPTAKEETEKLLLVGFIHEAWYTTWLANMVMVTKLNDMWKMYMDYTNLNRVCPKDSYPLPNIDRLVHGAANHKVFSFLDAYSGYNQISMHPWDKEKTVFVTDDAHYYYEVIPFDLKNARATY